jgi:rhodanese-related sulfurtransferase
MKPIAMIILWGVLLMSAETVDAAAQAETWDELMQVLYDNTVPLIEPEEALDYIAQQDPVILDIRSVEEQKISIIGGSRPLDYDSFTLDQVPDIPKERPILVYCALGYRSEKIGQQLLEAGYSQVYNLKGGIIHWKNQDLTIQDPNGALTSRVHGVDPTWGRWLTNGEVVYQE